MFSEMEAKLEGTNQMTVMRPKWRKRVWERTKWLFAVQPFHSDKDVLLHFSRKVENIP